MVSAVSVLVILAVLGVATPLSALGQTVQVSLGWQGKPIALPHSTMMGEGKTTTLELVKLYLHYQQQGQWVHHLLDFESQAQHTLPIRLEQDSMVIYLGTAKGLDARGVRSGPLDPSQGMYWTWLTGYIQAKVVGSSTMVKHAKNKFEYHLGHRQDQAYELPHLVLKKSASDQVIMLDMACWLQQTNMATQPKLVEPGNSATALLQAMANCCIINQVHK